MALAMLAMKRKIFWLEPAHPALVEDLQRWVAARIGTRPERSAVIRGVLDCIAEWANPKHPDYGWFVETASAQHTLRGQERQPRNYYVWPRNFIQLRQVTAQLAELGVLVDESMLVRLALERIATRFTSGDCLFISGFGKKVEQNIAPKGRASTAALGGAQLPMASD
ncbi:MAG: hypothetical protein C4333_00540 [Meiothermus sp.]